MVMNVGPCKNAFLKYQKSFSVLSEELPIQYFKVFYFKVKVNFPNIEQFPDKSYIQLLNAHYLISTNQRDFSDKSTANNVTSKSHNGEFIKR